jgi:hypothetical protein
VQVLVRIFCCTLVDVTAGFVLEQADDLEISRFCVRTGHFDRNLEAACGIERFFGWYGVIDAEYGGASQQQRTSCQNNFHQYFDSEFTRFRTNGSEQVRTRNIRNRRRGDRAAQASIGVNLEDCVERDLVHDAHAHNIHGHENPYSVSNTPDSDEPVTNPA